jgi:hypothetical protein
MNKYTVAGTYSGGTIIKINGDYLIDVKLSTHSEIEAFINSEKPCEVCKFQAKENPEFNCNKKGICRYWS